MGGGLAPDHHRCQQPAAHAHPCTRPSSSPPSTCLYLVSCCAYLPEPDDAAVLAVAHSIYTRMGKHHDALRVALHINE